MAEYRDFIKYTGYGDITTGGLHSWNCRHTFGAFDPEIDTPPLSDAQLAEQRKRDLETKKYSWRDLRGVKWEREFTYREALDRQREMERQMRITRSNLNLLRQLGLKEPYQDEYNRYRAQSAEYTRFAESMGIDEQRERIYVDGIGRILKWRKEWEL